MLDGAMPPMENWDGLAGDRLPAHGNALRHIYKDVALAVGVDDFQQRLLMGHSLRGVSQKYLTQAVISLGPSLRASQAKISKRIVSLLTPAAFLAFRKLDSANTH